MDESPTDRFDVYLAGDNRPYTRANRLAREAQRASEDGPMMTWGRALIVLAIGAVVVAGMVGVRWLAG